MKYQVTRTKVVSALLILVSIVGAIGCSWLSNKGADVFRSMPAQSSIVLETNGLKSFDRMLDSLPNDLWKPVLTSSFFGKFQKDLHTAATIFPEGSSTWLALQKNKLLAGLALNDSDSLHAVFALDLGEKARLEQWLTESKTVIKKFPSTFKQHTVFTLQLAHNERFAVCAHENLLLFSRLPYLVEDAVTALEKNESVLNDKDFEKLSDGQLTGIRLYLSTENMVEQVSSKITPEWATLMALLQRNLGWTRWDWDGHSMTRQGNGKGFLSKVSEWGEVPRTGIFEVVPDNTAILLWAGFSNKLSFFKKIVDNQTADFEYFIASWAGKEAAFVLTEPFSSNLSEEQFILFSVQDSAKANDRLEEYGQKTGILKSYDYQTFLIRQYASQVAIAPLLGAANTQFRNPVCARVGKYVVFSHSKAAMELWIDKYIVSQTLSNSEDFLLLQKQFATSGTGLFYAKAEYFNALAKTILQRKNYEQSEDFWKNLQKTGLFAIDFNSEKIAYQTSGKHIAETSILWKTPLAADVVKGPFVVEYPKAGVESAILVQDARNQLYRLTANGEIVWKRQLNGRLSSTVHGIDFQKNKTVCYLFNTSQEICLMDDEGNDVEGFPLKLSSPSLNGVSVANFRESEDYAFFVSCANGNTYGYDRYGRPLPGWNPQPGTGIVKLPLLHFQNDHKDYLCLLNKNGQLFVYARNGDTRFKTTAFEGNFLVPLQVDAGKQSPRIVAATSDGKAYICNLMGETFALPLGSPELKMSGFVFAPLTSDARYDYASLSGKTFSVKGYEANTFKTFSKTVLSVPPDTIFDVSLGQAGHRIGALNRQKRQIVLLDSKSTIHPDFPLAGTTPFSISDIFQNGKGNVLIVGNGSNIYAYKIRI